MFEFSLKSRIADIYAKWFAIKIL